MDFSSYPRLTTLSKGSGCGCKLAPAVLEKILASPAPSSEFPDLLVGFASRDDAAVFRISDTESLISTTDFFTPMVDDPISFGRIAAANALSDVYAMGGTPLLALSVLGWPIDVLPAEMAAAVLAGAREVCALAGIPLAGGHSIESKEPFFGLAVTGRVLTKQLKKNDSAQIGDWIYLTKPLGTGIAAAALKRGLATETDIAPAIQQMETLNLSGAYWSQFEWIHALTDITGFGLLGHLKECCGMDKGAEVWFGNIPILDIARKYAADFVFPDNTWRNWQSLEAEVSLQDGTHMPFLADPQTNGGLLIAVDPEHKTEFEQLWKEVFSGIEVSPIGRFTSEKGIKVTT
jgi:selenide,water dikinase